MPLADFSAIFQCPHLVDTFTILRRAEHIDQHGRTHPMVVEVIKGIGVVTIAGPNELHQELQFQYQSKTLSIATPSHIQGPREGQQADVIRWGSRATGGVVDDYLVIDLQDYSNFGPGFVNVLASRLDARLPFPSEAQHG